MTVSLHDRANLRVQTASVAVAATLVIAKAWALYSTGALSVAASLADSGLDLMVSLGGLWAIRYAQRPPDADHHFGHSSAEDLAALAQSAFIGLSAIGIAATAVARVGNPPELQAEGAGIAVMILSIALTAILVVYQTRVARVTGNRIVAADRMHYIGDLLPNIGAIAALWASQALGLVALDTVIAVGAATWLAIGSARIGSGAWHALMDRAAPDDMVAAISALAAAQPGVEGHHDLRTRTAGARVFVNLHLEIDGTLTLDEAHEIGEALRHDILARYPGTDVIIHHDPV